MFAQRCYWCNGVFDGAAIWGWKILQDWRILLGVEAEFVIVFVSGLRVSWIWVNQRALSTEI
jgi:hypothetical protein